MTGSGWEFYSINFSVLMTMVLSVGMFLYVMISTSKDRSLGKVDGMAGDEGED